MNASEFLKAVDNIVKEKNIDKEIVFEAMEAALTTAFKKNYGKSNSKVVINRETGDIKVYSYLTVIDDNLENRYDALLFEARNINSSIQ